MPIAFVGAGTTFASTSTGTTITLHKPGGAGDAHLLVAFVTCSGFNSISIPDGWNLSSSINFDPEDGSGEASLFVLTKNGLNSDPSSWSAPLGSSTNRRWARVFAYSGAAGAAIQFIDEAVGGDSQSNILRRISENVVNNDPESWQLSFFLAHDDGVDTSSPEWTTSAYGMILPGIIDSYASTPHDASLDITGDLDIRVDFRLEDWESGSEDRHLVAKWWDGSYSYALILTEDMHLQLLLSTDGISITTRTSTEPVEQLPGAGRIALRVTFDADDAGNNTATFYTASNISDSWTQLGDTVTASGVFTIHAGFADLEIGTSALSNVWWEGTIFGAEVRSSIGGAVVANPDFSSQNDFTTEFVDGSGKTWTVHGNAEIKDLGPGVVRASWNLGTSNPVLTIGVFDTNGEIHVGDRQVQATFQTGGSSTEIDFSVIWTAIIDPFNEGDHLLDALDITFNNDINSPGYSIHMDGLQLLPGNPHSIDFFRRDPTGFYSDESVRGLANILIQDNKVDIVDYETPINRDVRYYLRLFYANDSEDLWGPFTPDPPFIPIQKDAYGGGLCYAKVIDAPSRSLPLMVEELEEWNQPGRVLGKYEVLGRRNPVVITDAFGGREGGLSGHCILSKGQNVRQLQQALSPGMTLLLQNTNVEMSVFPDMYIKVESASFKRHTKMVANSSTSDVIVSFSLDYVEVDRPDPTGISVALITWADLNDTHSSWQQVFSRNQTWNGVLANPFGPE